MSPTILFRQKTASAIPLTFSLFAYPYPAQPETETYRVLVEWGDGHRVFLRLDIDDAEEGFSPVFEPDSDGIEVTTVCEGIVQWDRHHGRHCKFPEPLNSYLFILASLTLMQGEAGEVFTGTLIVAGCKSTHSVPGEMVLLLEAMLQPLGPAAKMRVRKKKKKKPVPAKKVAKKK